MTPPAKKLRDIGTNPAEDPLPRTGPQPSLPSGGVEVHDIPELEQALAEGTAPARLRLQDIDLRGYHGLDERTDLAELVVLGGHLDPSLDAHLRHHGAIVFPDLPAAAPIRPYRARLYTAEELYAGIDSPEAYAATADGAAYAWYRDRLENPDVFSALLQAIHDDSISDALAEFVHGHRVVGVMGGHALARGSSDFAQAAVLGQALADEGFLVATGGGPGAMEAANLGATARSRGALDEALAIVAQVPGFQPDIAAWVRAGLRALTVLREDGAPADAAPDGPPRSLGIPTWFYGHEPPNVFPEGIAKYFSNAIREDGLLALSTGGVVVLPGAAGTVQEIFQVATRSYYADAPPAPLILVGREHWTTTIPVWPALQALGAGRLMAQAIHLVDHPEQARELLGASPVRPLASR